MKRILPKDTADSVVQKGSRLAQLYGLPKTHKKQLAMRPILSATGTYNYKLAKWLDKTLKPLSANDHTVSDIFGFVCDLRNIQVDDHSILFSYDISSLFANVPVDETIEILAEKAFKGDWFNEHNLHITKADLVELLNIATKNQLFQFEGTLYEQVDDVAMGSPLGPLMANTFMCSIEERLQDQGKVPGFYKCYVDDTLSIMPNVETAETFLSTLNNSHPSIRDFVTAKVLGDVRSKQTCDDKKAPVRIILPFKDQRSANCVRRQLGEFSRKIGKDIHPVYTTRKIGPNIRPKESKPLIVNQ